MNIYQLESGAAVLTRVANRVYKWAKAAALKLNSFKTKAMICRYRDFVDRIPHDLPRIEVSGTFVPYVETAKNLGVMIVSKFTWKPQFEAVAKKINHELYSLIFFYLFPRQTASIYPNTKTTNQVYRILDRSSKR